MKLTFRIKMFICFAAVVVVTSISIALVSFISTYTSLKKDSITSTSAQMVLLDNFLSNMFKNIKQDNSLLTTDPLVTSADRSIIALFNMKKNNGIRKYSGILGGKEEAVYHLFERYAMTHPDTAYVYMGTKWGGYVQWPDGLSINKYDPRVRPWYKNAMANPGSIVISGPYASYDQTKECIVSTSSVVKDPNGNVIGVVGIDVSLRRLSQYIKNIKFGKDGYAFIYTNDGIILAHPDTRLNFSNIKNLSEPNKSVNGVKYAIKDYKKLLIMKNGYFKTLINGESDFVNIFTEPNSTWKLASVISSSELQNRINKIAVFTILIVMFLLILVLALIAFITKAITSPIRHLTPLMNAAGNGDLTVSSAISTKDEFGELSHSFNLMIGKLRTSNEELVAVYEELTATNEELQMQYEELQEKGEELRDSDERYRLATEGANDVIWELDLITNGFFASYKLYEVTGYTKEDTKAIFSLLQNRIHPDDWTLASKDYANHMDNITPIFSSEFRIKTKEGDYIWVALRGKAMRNSENKAIKLAGSLSNISERKKDEEKIKFMAYYDVLTGLPNRAYFINRLNDHLKDPDKNKLQQAVFFIDLDNFKNINDTMGHDFGDKLIMGLANRLKDSIGHGDQICRFGGDEFIILYTDMDEPGAENAAVKLLSMFDDPFMLEDKQIYVTCSIGIALYPRDGLDSGTLMKNADTAMYRAKESGKNKFVLYDESISRLLDRRTSIERILRTCIENNELSVHYQPQYNLINNRIYGFEALLRLNSKELGQIPPDEFIPIAEKAGSITSLDLWVLAETLRQAEKWIKEGYPLKNLGINISTVDINQSEFIENFKAILDKSEISPQLLDIEITETELMQNLDMNLERLQELKDMGLRISLDDFGTGFSSLNYLRRIPIATLKIDKSFIDHITSDKKEEEIVRNIIQMAHSMGLKVIAEGVETEPQLLILNAETCDFVQGYYFSKPLPPDLFRKLMEEELK